MLWLSVITVSSKYGFLEYNFTKLTCLPLRKHGQILQIHVVRYFEKHENQILTHIAKKILKTVLFHVYTFLLLGPALFGRILDNPCEPSAS